MLIGLLQVLHHADHGPAVRVLPVCAHQHFGQDRAVGPVPVVLHPLLLHHLALGVHADAVHTGMQHAFALQPQAQLQAVRRQHFIVVGAVGRGVGVEHAAGLLHVPAEGPAFDVPRPLEQQMLEEMREAPAVRLVVLAAHVVHHPHGHDRRAAVRVQDHMQAIVQGELREGDGRDAGEGVRCGRRCACLSGRQGGGGVQGGVDRGRQDKRGTGGSKASTDLTAHTDRTCPSAP